MKGFGGLTLHPGAMSTGENHRYEFFVGLSCQGLLPEVAASPISKKGLRANENLVLPPPTVLSQPQNTRKSRERE